MSYLRIAIVLLVQFFAVAAHSSDQEINDNRAQLPLGVILDELVAIGYSGSEKLSYDVSWSGGIKIGELHMEINEIPDVEDGFEIRVMVTTKNGAVHYIYPIKDLHVTKVRGEKKLPYHYEIWQKEGYNYEAHSIYEFDQDVGTVRHTKHDKFQGEYTFEGEVNNEFSSFFNSRLMQFEVGEHFIVPTFADKRKVDVEVNVVSKTQFKKSLIGPVVAAEILPIMTFEGLYEKKGDTVIWYSDDECRVPVKVKSKIKIGSLTAQLSAFENLKCKRYTSALNKFKNTK